MKMVETTPTTKVPPGKSLPMRFFRNCGFPNQHAPTKVILEGKIMKLVVTSSKKHILHIRTYKRFHLRLWILIVAGICISLSFLSRLSTEPTHAFHCASHALHTEFIKMTLLSWAGSSILSRKLVYKKNISFFVTT